jgi:hypothetical protein
MVKKALFRPVPTHPLTLDDVLEGPPVGVTPDDVRFAVEADQRQMDEEEGGGGRNPKKVMVDQLQHAPAGAWV